MSDKMPTEEFSHARIQQWMQDMILPHDVQPAGAAVNDMVHASSRLSPQQHLDIYKGSYIARLREVMRTQFSALAYAHPSGSYTLNTLGEKFPAFLSATRPDAEEEIKESWPDFMIELAAFEYSLSVIFDEPSPEAAPIAGESTPDERLQLSPVFHLFQHQYPVCRYFLDFKQGKDPELPFPAESFCAVTRVDYQLGLFEIKPVQYHFLSILKQTNSIETAKKELCSLFNFPRTELDNAWLEWRMYFVTSRFFVIA
jgi:hypothetical protein